MKTTILVCPFAQFGNPGTMAGAELLADAVRELLDDNAAESRATRARVYQPHVRLEEVPLATPKDYAGWRVEVSSAAARAWDRGEFLLYIGGNHLSAMPLYEELGRGGKAAVVQFDAHLDIYHHDDTVRELSHGNFIAHLPTPRPTIVNVGHRDQFLVPADINEHFAAALGVEQLADEKTIATAIQRHTRSARHVLLDIDWDVLDPAYFPAVVDALPFGLSPPLLLRLLRSVWSDRVRGMALTEFEPGRDDCDRSLQLAMWLIEQVLLWRYED